MNKFVAIMVGFALLALVGMVVVGDNNYSIGNDDANIQFERVGRSNMYGLKYNVATTNEPLLEVYNGIDYMILKSFGESVLFYSNSADVTILPGVVMTENGPIATEKYVQSLLGITIEIELENYTLVIVNGIIVEVK